MVKASKKKERNLWSAEGGTKAVARPQPVTIAKGWAVSPEILPAKEAAPRRRKYAQIRPNNRAAVAIPLEGQSYNPTDGAHQAALSVAVKHLEKKKAKDEKFVKMMMLGRDQQVQRKMSTTGAEEWTEEDVREEKTKVSKSVKSDAVKTKEAKEAKKKAKKAKKLGKKGGEREARRALMHRRHPQRSAVEKEVEDLDAILTTHAKKEQKKEVRRLRKREALKDNLKIKHYGRHYYTPLAVDVAPTDKLVGSLRHMNGGYIHPALDRMKSIEERNLVPARMTHRYNKRKLLKPKGEVRVKRETVGVLPETSF